jgi:EamA domain-containing membrane protein RarD
VNNGYLWYAMKKVNPFSVIGRLKKIFAASVLMAACGILFMTLGMNVIVNTALCVCIYFGALRILREPLLIEVKHIIMPVTS